MAVEIERKFLVTGTAWKDGAEAVAIRQGYLLSGEGKSLRVRIKGERSFLTLKAGRSGLSVSEFEYEIPLADGQELMDKYCQSGIISKTRYLQRVDGRLWEIDEFDGENAGLVVAEIELSDPDEEFDRPVWLGAEVSHDKRYFNAALARHPYHDWDQE